MSEPGPDRVFQTRWNRAAAVAQAQGTLLGTFPRLRVLDEVAQGSASQTFSGSELTRRIQTIVVNEIPGASLGSDQITLPVGTYDLSGFCTVAGVNQCYAYLRNTTDANVIESDIRSLSGFAGDADVQPTSLIGNYVLFLRGRFAIASTKVFDIRVQGGQVISSAMGRAMNFAGFTEVYLDMEFQQLSAS